jgi:hypothetical protein
MMMTVMTTVVTSGGVRWNHGHSQYSQCNSSKKQRAQLHVELPLKQSFPEE